MEKNNVLILGSAPNAILAKNWPHDLFKWLVAINNAWKIRSDWSYNIFPTDFPKKNRPKPVPTQKLISAPEYVPVQNNYGGFVYAGGTMAITAAYWALAVLKPQNLFFLGCDMVYGDGKTHFYGTGKPDPLRKDVSLRSLEAKTARFECFASLVGCGVYNLSEEKESRLIYRRQKVSSVSNSIIMKPRKVNRQKLKQALELEKQLNYFVSDGKYWKYEDQFETSQIDDLDKLWLQCLAQ